jgi:hypothetical protein
VLTLLYSGKKIKLDDRMLSILQYALDYPNTWHNMGTDKASIATTNRLEKAGLVEIRDFSHQYRVKP